MTLDREILVAPRQRLPPHWLPREGARHLSWREAVETLEACGTMWLQRTRAERDPAYKQLIPYVTLREVSGRIAAYRRAGRERRLHGLWSAGIGGHVDREDAGPAVGETLQGGARRELAEELIGEVPGSLDFLGVINEDVTEVGRVHLGLVFTLEVIADRVAAGPELGELLWLDAAKLGELGLERWSRLALALVAGGKLAGSDIDSGSAYAGG